MNICYAKVAMPTAHENYLPVNLSRETMEEHRRKVLEQMQKEEQQKEQPESACWFTVTGNTAQTTPI